MLTPKDLTKRLGIDLQTVAELHGFSVLPEPVRIGGKCRWREEDVTLFCEYLLARRECREQGIDPDGPSGPPVPVYSMGLRRFDPREASQRKRERERQQHSKTLAKGTAPIAEESLPTIPELNTDAKKAKR